MPATSAIQVIVANVSVVPPPGTSLCDCMQLPTGLLGKGKKTGSQVYVCVCGKAEEQVETGNQREEGSSSQLP